MPEQLIPNSANLEEILTDLHSQLFIMRSQVAAWQSSSTIEEETRAFSLMEQCCQMDWEIGQSLVAMLNAARGGREQKGSSSPIPMGTPSPILSNSLPNATPLCKPSSMLKAISSTLAAN